MSRSAGPGSPLSFQCWKCRLQNWGGGRGRVNRVVLTGKTKKRGNRRHHCVGLRHGHILHQYECLDCGHVGYSGHYEMEKYGRGKSPQLPACCTRCEHRDETIHDPPCSPENGDGKGICAEWDRAKEKSDG